MASRRKHSLRLKKDSWRLEAKTTVRILLVLALLGLLGWLCLNQATKISTVRYRLREKEMKLARLSRANDESLAEVTEMLSLARLKARAQDLGYALPDRLQYLEVPDYPATCTGLCRSDSLSRGELPAVPKPDESAVAVSPVGSNYRAASEESEDKAAGIGRWWEEVLSQFVIWTERQP